MRSDGWRRRKQARAEAPVILGCLPRKHRIRSPGRPAWQVPASTTFRDFEGRSYAQIGAQRTPRRPQAHSRGGSGWGCPGSSFWALRHPFLNLRGELIECKRTRRLVRIDVLAVPFAAVDEELAVTANQGASPKRNVHSLRNDVAAEHLGRYAWH